MPISRRTIIRDLGVGALVGAAAPALQQFRPPASDRRGTVAKLGFGRQSTGRSSAGDPVLLYRNENPYGPSEKVLAVLRESVAGGNRYPRTEYETLKEKLAALHRVKPEQIVLGCGSAEILCMSAHAFLGPGKKLVQAAPTFPALGKLAAGARAGSDAGAHLFFHGAGVHRQPQQSYGNDHAAQRHRRFCQQAAERRRGYRRRGLPSLRQPWRLVRVFPGPAARRSAPDCLPHILEGVWPSRHAYRLRRR